MAGKAVETGEEAVILGIQAPQGPASGSCISSAGSPECRMPSLTLRTVPFATPAEPVPEVGVEGNCACETETAQPSSYPGWLCKPGLTPPH